MYCLLGELCYNLKFSHQDLLSSVVPLLKLLTLTLIGLVLAHRKTQIVPKATFKLLSKLVFVLFLPCLIFIHLGQSISIKNITLWWFIPVNVLISTAVDFVLGILVVFVCRPSPEFVRFTIIMTAFGNTGNLPIAIIGSVCHTEDSPFGPHCRQRGVAYVSFAQWVAVILVYTLVYHMMEPQLEYYEIVDQGAGNKEHLQNVAIDEKQQQIVIKEQGQQDAIDELRQLDAVKGESLRVTVEVQSQHGVIEEQTKRNAFSEQQLHPSISKPLLVEAEWPGIEDKETEHCKTPFIARIFRNITSVTDAAVQNLDYIEEGNSNSPKTVRCLAEPKMVRKIRIVAEMTPIRHFFQPPTIASLLAIFIGLVPQIKALVFGIDAPLSFMTDSFEILAGAMVPSVMLILGGMLAEGPNDSKLGLRTTVGIIVARLLILPLLGIVVVALADKLHLLVSGDRMFKFVLLLQYTTPSAILLGAIASLRGYAVCESSALLFWQHLFALLSLSIYTVIYFKLLPSI